MPPLLERFVELCGGEAARIVLVTTATGTPDEVHADYERVFRRLGADRTVPLRLRGRSDADGDDAAKIIQDATGILRAPWTGEAATTEATSQPPAPAPPGASRLT